MGLSGIFQYFARIDLDGSGFLELNEIYELAEQIFGTERNDEIKEYVAKVFDEYDTDRSGELSYEEARNFIKGIYTFFESGGKLSDSEKRKLLGIIDDMDAEDAQMEEIKEEVIVAAPVAVPVEIPPPEPVRPEPVVVKPKPVENVQALVPPVPLPPVIDSVIVPEQSDEVKKLLTESPKFGTVVPGELHNQEDVPVLGQFKEFLGADGNALPGKFGQIIAPPVADSLLGEFGELLGPDGKPLLGRFGELLGPDGKALLGKFGEIRGPNGSAILGPNGEILDAEGRAILGKFGEILNRDGEPILGKFGQLLAPGGASLLGPHNEILKPGGTAKLGRFGELLGADGVCLLGQFGQILQADGTSLLGRYGELTGPDGLPLLGLADNPIYMLGPDGKLLQPLRDADGKKVKIDAPVVKQAIGAVKVESNTPTYVPSPKTERKKFVEPERKEKQEKPKPAPEPRVIGKLAVDPNLSDVAHTNGSEKSVLKVWDYTNIPVVKTQAELRKEAAKRKQSLIDNLKTAKREGNDGYHEDLEIYLPKASITDLEIMKELAQIAGEKLSDESKFFRDPVTKQWIGKEQVTNPEKRSSKIRPDEPEQLAVAQPVAQETVVPSVVPTPVAVEQAV